MKNLANIEEVGHGIATAFVATVYGVALANLFCLPAANKMKSRVKERRASARADAGGSALSSGGMNPKLIRTKLEAYAPRQAGGGQKARRRPKPPASPPPPRANMARKKAHPEHEKSRALAGLVRRLHHSALRVFRVMFATSQTDKAKAQQVSDSVKEALEHGGIKAVVHEILGGTVDDKGKKRADARAGRAQKQDKEPKESRLPELTPSCSI